METLGIPAVATNKKTWAMPVMHSLARCEQDLYIFISNIFTIVTPTECITPSHLEPSFIFHSISLISMWFIVIKILKQPGTTVGLFHFFHRLYRRSFQGEGFFEFVVLDAWNLCSHKSPS